MAAKDDEEEERLRSVTLQNARSILVARERAEDALRKQSDWLRVTLASIGDAVISTDAEGRVTFMNAVAEALTGWPRGEAEGQPLPEVFRIINEKTRDPAENPALRALREGTIAGLANHTVLIARDGTERPIDDSAAPIRDDAGANLGAVLVFRDVTERRQAEEALRRKEAELRDFIENATVGLHWVGADGTILWANQAELALLGYAQQEYIGRNIIEFHLDRPVIDDIMNRLLNKEEMHGYEARLRCKDGSVKHVLINSSGLWEGERFLHTRCFTHDITDRKRAEESRVRLAAIVESSDDAIVSKTLEGTIQSWNAGAERIFGYTAREAVGRPITMIIPPDRLDEERMILERIRRGEPVEHLETVRVAKDGRRVDISLTVSPLRDEKGRVIGASKVARDITERKRAEEERRRLQDEVEAERSRLVEVFRRAPSFLAVMRGPDHVFELANDRYCQLVGGRDIIGKPIREALPEVEGQGFFELLDSVYQTGEPFVGTDLRVMLQWEPGRPLEERFVDFVYQPLRDAGGAVSGIIAQGVDLTDRKRAEAAVRERDERLRLFLGNATDYAFIITDPEGLTLAWQGGAEQITGWQADEMFGKPASVIFTSQDRAAGLSDAEMARAARDGRSEDKRWHVKKDGSWFFADGVMVSLRGPQGELRGFGKVFRDATEQKQAEDALREADRRKDEFIALLAHELRNPLAPLRNGLQVMRLASGDADAVAQARAMMERQLGHMVRLIDDLLDVSRISQNKMELRLSRVNLRDVLGSAVETAIPVIEEAGHELIVSLPTEPVLLDADLTRLAQVFANLLSNSAKYTERGGRIWLSAERRGGEVVVSVRDTGIGIPPDALPRIFDMFSQVDRSIERSTGGLGIGLALVKGLAEMHGGTVIAESAGQGMGSLFTVRLPVRETIHEPDDAGPPSAARTGGEPKRRILVVDDNHDSARSMARLLKLMGNEARVAHDGLEALEIADEYRPEVILMDVGMPRLNGFEAARRIRERPWGRSAIIIALTGWGQEGDRAKSKEAGCDGHLVKPVDVAELERLLAELTGARG